MPEERFSTASPLPPRLHRLHELALDLWWSWDDRARSVFRQLDYSLWRATAHNPVQMLQRISPERLSDAAADPNFLKAYDEAIFGLDQARTVAHPWWRDKQSMLGNGSIAYFSAEFALHQSLPIYAGGLGVLAGDHCKEAADLGLPFVGIGFMYPQGYFRQRMSNEGWQEERYEKISWTDAPIEAAITPDGRPCITAVPLGDRTVLAAVWRVRLGRVRLFLLDTDLAENAPWDRELSARLYGGDRETRIQQEIILGIGGVRALRALGITPTVWHLNEGHAAFVALQRIREIIEQGRSFDDALEEVKRSTVFTTHTPVPAGHDAFPFQLVEKHLASTWGEIGQHRRSFLALGEYDNGSGSQFNMTALALRTAAFVNGVSALHGEVTRSMWRPMWPDTPADQIPVRSITNGVHVPTWMGGPVFALLDHHFGPGWLDHVDETELWERLNDIPDAEIWQMRQALRHDLFSFIRERMRSRFSQEHVGQSRIVSAGAMLDPEALTLGYARRFTAYKRPEMIFHDSDRLARILNATDRPVQIVFAGKAHPADEPAKHNLQRVFRHALDPKFGGRIAFIDDYDMHVAHYLVQGCDVWLNNPRKPLEASGTSGMKASLNGVPHLSIGDGWWAEGFNGRNGWLIDGHTNPDDHAATDAADANALYELLENDVVPAFYDRDRGGRGLPRRWIAIVREAMRSNVPRFSTRRMVKQYVTEMYGPAAQAKSTSDLKS
ncbi:MAG TPA: alpha-glucan family phosphorylase [Vicinamibacterales bacterium]|nr:alpha-glucan family phosphorylase [Vicinamibacterales bacterium]